MDTDSVASFSGKSVLLSLPVWGVVGIACALPLGWVALQLVAHPDMLSFAWTGGRFVGRTLVYSGCAAAGATLMALPAALVIGRGRTWVRRGLMLVLPITLLLPSLTYTYGWRQFLEIASEGAPGSLLQRWAIWFLTPGETGDIVRCIWTLATWLWPISAMGIGLSLRSLDPNVQQQAVLDGAMWRVTLRMLSGTMAACFAVTMVLAAQEFVVYETTGISVVATKVRMLYEGEAGGMLEPGQRAAAAVSAALPMAGATVALCLLALWRLRKFSPTGGVHAGEWPRIVGTPRWAAIAALVIVSVNVGVPLASMAKVLKRAPDVPQMLQAFAPHIEGSLVIGGSVGLCLLCVALAATIRRSRGAMWLSLACFLVGGQIIAIADVLLYNRPWLNWAYNSPLIMILGHVALFAWLALLGARATWSRPMLELRDMAAMDGAGRLRTAASVVWPLAWPTIVGAAVLTMILSMTEIAATALLRPMNPPVLITPLLTWVHIQRSPDMVEASLLLAGIVMSLAIALVGLIAGGLRLSRALTR